MRQNKNQLSDVSVVVKLKRFDRTLPIPAYQSTGAAGFDLYARERVEIASGEIGYVPLNVALQLPEGHWAMLAARSSLHKKGLLLANGVGIGDYDYRGDGDEYRAALWNFSKKSVVIERAERIVQVLILPIKIANLVDEVSFENVDRGGFGSTGK